MRRAGVVMATVLLAIVLGCGPDRAGGGDDDNNDNNGEPSICDRVCDVWDRCGYYLEADGVTPRPREQCLDACYRDLETEAYVECAEEAECGDELDQCLQLLDE